MDHVAELLKSLYIMASMVEARDPYTGGHLWRVSQFSRILASDIPLPDTDVARIALGGFLHDLGKIGVPDAILNKPGPLSEEEYAVIRTHPEVGNRLLSEHPLAALARAAVFSHHEMPNGKGYPQRLSGKDIPIDARIVGICDAFDAMTSTRPYRRGMPIARALSIIEENLGAQFDAELGARFIALGQNGKLDAVVGFSEFGIPVQECPLCGPTIVVRRGHRSGDHVYCRHCGAEAVVAWEGNAVHIASTGKKGTVEDLQPEIDVNLIDALIRETVRHIKQGAISKRHGFFGLFR
ncbi:MAG: phosphohydrolase [Hydrogenophilales bacterium CG_4_10_14_3_um_filter_63_21]|nr:MAG: phosphohydrolase [Hydrogenophilales bacterium CG_4_10_14_3_um_filter_63_21]